MSDRIPVQSQDDLPEPLVPRQSGNVARCGVGDAEADAVLCNRYALEPEVPNAPDRQTVAGMRQLSTPPGRRLAPPACGTSLSTFVAIWLAQTLSLVGTATTGFALGVHFFQQTQSTTVYGLIGLATLGPQIAFTPLAGVFADRFPRRLALMAGHLLAATCSLLLCALLVSGQFGLIAVLSLVGVASIANSIHFPSFSALTTELVAQGQLSRANGLVEVGLAVPAVVAPPLGAWAIGSLDLRAVLLFDVLTFVTAIVILHAIRGQFHGSTPRAAVRSVTAEIRFAYDFISTRSGLAGLVVFFFVTNFLFGTVQLLLTPMLLGFGTVQDLGSVLGWGGAGGVAGGVIMLAWGGPRRKLRGIVFLTVLQGALFLCAVMTFSLPLVTLAVVGVVMTVPMMAACSQTLWQQQVPVQAQGRVFALRATVAELGIPLAMVTIGPLAEGVFEPLLLDGSELASTFGPLVGLGPGRGTALLIALAGVLMITSAIALFSQKPARQLDRALCRRASSYLDSTGACSFVNRDTSL